MYNLFQYSRGGRKITSKDVKKENDKIIGRYSKCILNLCQKKSRDETKLVAINALLSELSEAIAPNMLLLQEMRMSEKFDDENQFTTLLDIEEE